MLRFNLFKTIFLPKSFLISIHPMLRFNQRTCFSLFKEYIISIHPMLRFNLFFTFSTSFVAAFQYILCYGSTSAKGILIWVQHRFQYILCYGSTVDFSTISLNVHDFNTSYVTVQHIRYNN